MTIVGEIRGQHRWNGAAAAVVEFRTNGLQGGDAGHGGFLKITFRNETSTDLAVSVDGHPEIRPVQSLTLTFRGDAEFALAMQMFEFLSEKLSTVRQMSLKDYTPEYPEPDMSDFANLEGRRAA